MLDYLYIYLPVFFAQQVYERFQSALPQEYGMIFIVPTIYFLIRFFQTKREDLKSKETKWVLRFFAMSFALTLIIHFYGTMIAGICCVGIAFGFSTRFFRKEYFTKIMVTGLISIFLAILPMGIAVAGGTALQGSIGWGMSVINGSSTTDTQTEETQVDIQDFNEKNSKKPVMEKLVKSVSYNLFSGKKIYKSYSKIGSYIVVGMIGAIVCLGLIHCIFKRREYGMVLLSMGFCMGMLLILLASNWLGLPVLMDTARSSVYFAYLLVMAASLFLDGSIYLVFMADKLTILRNLVSALIMITVAGFLFENHMFKRLDFESNFNRNGAIICLSNIIHENKDMTWTIVSANDELQMAMDHGWHYETINFLRKMEHWTNDSKVRIPTHKIYFFIEKIPVNYYYNKKGSKPKCISRKTAGFPLPQEDGIPVYQKENRNIVMSKMYYWAETFRMQYPNEMKVYYESDDFICYEITQDTYYQYNFAIDYGYNQVQTQEMGD